MSQEETQNVSNSVELVKVTQLPVIEDQLRSLRSWVEKTVAGVDSMVCNEGTLLEVKSFRADLNNLFKELEIRRKEVLAEVEAPIKQFNATYKECVSDYFKKADNTLREKVVSVESEMKARCEDGLRVFFDEYAQVNGIAFLKYEQAGIVVSMAEAKAKNQPPKKLKEEIEKFILRVSMDVDMILNLENAAEILTVYKQTLNATQAISAVAERHRKIEEARAEQEQRNTVKAQEVETARRFEAFTPPTVTEAPVPADVIPVCTMNIYNETRERLKLLKQWLDANGFKYS